MKRFIYLYFIFFAISVPAQQSTNRFEQAEYENSLSSQNNPDVAEVPGDCDNDGIPDATDPDPCGPGNVGDPTPIDDYLPLLVIAGIGLIAWKVRKRGVTL